MRERLKGDATPTSAPDRAALVRHALRLEYLTIGWNLVEGIVAVAAAVLAGSVALLGFGIDSFVETASGLVLVWRLRAEREGMGGESVERLDRRAHRLVGASLLLLAAYVALDAARALWAGERPSPSPVGMALTAVSIAAMLWLARAKRRAAARLGSSALRADAFQTTACFWLSLITLAGIGLNAVLGWWWADPGAALGMTWFIAREGREAWRGEACGCEGDQEAKRPSAIREQRGEHAPPSRDLRRAP
jgi:divalent metal cation (Fe/Co/Zn/Cd) transporter